MGLTVCSTASLFHLFCVQDTYFVKIQFAYWKSVSPCRTPPTMGCVRSKIEPLICESDEPKFLANWSHCKADNRIITSQSSSDISLVKIGRKENSNMAPGSCPSDSWYDELPEILIFILLFVFVLTIFRRWQGKRRAKAFRRAFAANTCQLQTVTSTVPFNGGSDKAWRGMGNRCLD